MNNPSMPPEEATDQIIGKAAQWSAVVFFLLVAVVTLALLISKRRSKTEYQAVTEIKPPTLPELLNPNPPHIPFKDLTESAGILFKHHNGATGDKLLPESLGGGVAFFDMDLDGDADLLFSNGTSWPWTEGGHQTTAALYRNDTSGPNGPPLFVDITQGSGLDVPLFGMGIACGDYNQDGFIDLFLTCVGGNKLFMNNAGSGTFTDVTLTAQVGGGESDFSTAATWLDYDRDGLLDLFVANYVRWSREIDFKVNFTLDGTHRAYGPPSDFQGAFPYLYRNKGDGTFEDVSQTSGLQVTNPATGVPVAKTLGVVPWDINRDQWVDLILANDTVPNMLFLNNQDGTFSEAGGIAGIAYDNEGRTRGAMGIDVAQYRNDSSIGIVIGNFSNEMTALYVSQGKPFPFSDEAIAEGIGPASRLPLKFGVLFFDFDLDGWLDIISVNGHLDEDITRLQKSQTYAQPAQLFWNVKGKGFQATTAQHLGQDLFEPIVGRGVAYADIDTDGDLDLVLTQVHGSPKLLLNQGPQHSHWIRFTLKGSTAQPQTYGTLVEISQASLTQIRRMDPTHGYLSQSELPLTFGLIPEEPLLKIKITWPDGILQELKGEDFPPGKPYTLVRTP